MRRPILNHLRRGELVYEPFLGSGTTLAAAELTERVCYGIELDPKYVDVVVQRWQTLELRKRRWKATAGLSRKSKLSGWESLHYRLVSGEDPTNRDEKSRRG